MTDTSPEALRKMADRLEINPREVTITQYHALLLAIRNNQSAATLLRALLAEREWRTMDSAPDGDDTLFFGRFEEITGPCHIDDIDPDEWDFWMPCQLPQIPTLPEA